LKRILRFRELFYFTKNIG